MLNTEPPLPNVTRIVSLESTNVKRLKAVRITPTGSLVVIGGANEAGKSSVLDSIAMALGGRNEMPPVPVRRGQKRGQIVIDLGEIIVKRTLTKEGGGMLTIEGADGTKFTSPQALLERLTGKIAFDPVSFMRLDAKKQAETLRQLTGLDFTAIDQERKSVYETRTTINREIDRLKGLYASLVSHADAPALEVSSADVLTEIRQANERNAQIQQLKTVADNDARSITSLRSNRDAQATHVADLESQITALQARLAAGKTTLSTINESITAAETRATESRRVADAETPVSLDPLEKKLAAVEETNRKVRANQQKENARKQLRDKETAAANLTQKIDDLDSKKQDTLAAVKFPVAGLGFNEDGVTFNDLPLAQASDAQQLRISVAIAAAMKPHLKVMLVRDGSLLDDNNLKLLEELAAQHSLQVWIERCSVGPEVQVLIEDGSIKGETSNSSEDDSPDSSSSESSAPTETITP